MDCIRPVTSWAILLTAIFFTFNSFSQCGVCPTVQVYDVDLSANPDTSWSVAKAQRGGECCSNTGDNCVRFNVTLHPQADELSWDITDGPNPGGQQFQVDCGTPINAGAPFCATGSGNTYCIVYCKPGNDQTGYTITSSRNIAASDDFAVQSTCTGAMTVDGVDQSTISWSSIYPGAVGDYNHYLSCTDSCDTTYVSPQIGYPDSLYYVVSANPLSQCNTNVLYDTVTVYILEGMTTAITPTDAAICPGNTTTTLTAQSSGGAPPYSYNWYDSTGLLQTGLDSTFITGIRTVWVGASDTTDGCPEVYDTVTVRPLDVEIQALAGNDTTICEGDSIVLSAGVISALGGVWSNYGGTISDSTDTLATYTPSATEITAGFIELVLTTTGNGGCTPDEDTILITIVPTPVAPTVGSNTPVCEGGDLNLTASVVSGATYSWTGPNSFTSSAQSPIRNSLILADSGSYSVMAIVNGCAGPAGTVDVTVVPIPVAPSLGSDGPLCETDNLNLTASTISGATYAWTGPNSFTSSVQNPTRNNVAPVDSGYYVVAATVNGCAGPSDSINVAITGTPAAPTVGNDGPLCEGDNLNLTASAVAGATYAWTGPNTFSSTLQNPTRNTVVLADSGTYSVVATINGCPGPAGSTTVVINGIPATSTAGSNSPICELEDLNLTATAVPGATYAWTGPNGFTSTSQNPTINLTPAANAGTYTVTATVSGCSSTSTNTTVTVNAAPATPVLGSNSPLCEGGTLNLTASTIVGVTYSWSGPNSFTSTDQNPIRTPLVVADSGYYVVFSIESGCSSPSDSLLVVVNATPVAPTAGSNSPLCENDNLNLTATTISGASYAWTGPNGFTSTAQNPIRSSVVANDSGSYGVSVTVNGCGGPTGSVNVTIEPTPVAPTLGSNGPLCETDNLNLTTSAISGASYSWTGPNAFTSLVQNPTRSGVTPLDSGYYVVVATLNGCSGPSDSINVAITGTPAAPATGNDGPLCEGNDLNLTASTVSGATYAWTGPNAFTASIQNPIRNTVALADSGTYSVVATVNGCPGPAANTTVVINGIPATSTAGSNSPICEFEDLNLTATAVPGATYAWTGPNGFTSTSQNPTINLTPAANAGTYTVTATVSGCSSTASNTAVTVNAAPATPVLGSNSPLCEGGTLNLTAITVAGATYSWSGPNGFSSTSQNPTRSPLVLADSGYYSVFAIESGCNGLPDSVMVVVNAIPVDPTVGSNSPVCEGDDLNLTATAVAGATYAWTGPNAFTSSSQNPTVSNVTTTNGGNYALTITVNSCPSTGVSTSVTVNPTPVAPTLSNNTSFCAGNTLNLSAGAVAGGTYSWTGPNGFNANTQNASIGVTVPADSGYFYCNVTVAGCTSSNDSTLATIYSIPTAPSPSSNSPVCEGADVNLSATAATGGIFNWIGPNSFTAFVQNPTVSSATLAADGYYKVSITNNGCTSAEDSVPVTITPLPAAPVVGSNTPVCEGTHLNLTASNIASASYAWSGPNAFASASQNPTISNFAVVNEGTYSVAVTVNGCTGPSVNTLVVMTSKPSLPVIGANTSVCLDDNLNLTSNTVAGVTYDWVGPNGYTSSSQNPTVSNFSASDSGTYKLVHVLAGCPSDTASISVALQNNPVVTAMADFTVCGDTAGVDVSGTVLGATDIGWTTLGTGTFSPDTIGTSATYIPSITDTVAGTVQLILWSTGNGSCSASSDTLSITITPAPTLEIGADRTVCASNPNTTLSASSTVAGSVTWFSSGTGTWNPLNTGFNTVYEPSDADTTNGSVQIIALTSGSGQCKEISDTLTINITNGLIVDAGVDDTICANTTEITLGGTVPSFGRWSTNGSGSFAPNDSTMNAVYQVAPADTLAGAISFYLVSTQNGLCAPAYDTIDYLINPGIYVNAGNDATYCSNNASVNLAASITYATGGTWISSGTGTFDDVNSLNAVYTPSAADTANGGVTLIVTSTGNNGCDAVRDTVAFTFTTSPYVLAGSDATVCNNNSDVSLTGSVFGATSTGLWTTSGTGTFNPSDTDLNATYEPSPADTLIGSLELVLEATSVGSCLDVYDTLVVTIIDQATVDAGSDIIICRNNAEADLAGLIGGVTTTGVWTSAGGGTFSPNNNDLSATYFPDSTELANGSMELYLESTVNSFCSPVRDTIQITINDAPVVDAGTPITICADSVGVQLSGNVTNADGGLWTSSGSGVFSPNDSTLNAIYLPDSVDQSNGSVTLTLTSTGIGNCIAVFDNTLLTITPVPVVNAGLDLAICANVTSVNILGSITQGASTGQWSSNGSGAFQPNNTSLTIDYEPSPADTAVGLIELYLTTTDHGQCRPVSDTMLLTIGSAPYVDAGTDQTICANRTVLLTGSSVTNSTVLWTTLGSGTFTPDDTSMSTVYVPSSIDTASGGVQLVITSTNNAGCIAHSDTMSVTFTPGPQVSAGLDIAVCANNNTSVLNGVVMGASSTGRWSTTGSGSFSPNDSTLSATYAPGATDTAGSNFFLVLTPTQIGGCLNSADTLTYAVSTTPVVEAGNNQIICFGDDVSLAGDVISTLNTGRWTTNGGGGFNPNIDDLNAVYTPVPNDTLLGSLEFVLESTNNGGCLTVYDTVNVDFAPFPSISAGADTSICANNLQTVLTGVVTGASTTGLWTTSGTGSFSPNDTTLGATYVPSSTDSASTGVWLTLTATNACEVRDSIQVTFTDAPIVNAGADVYICQGEDTASLSASITGGASLGMWSSSGSGAFDPNNTDLTLDYIMSTVDTANGSVILYLQTTDHGNCFAVMDSVKAEVTPIPSVDAGTPQTVCANVYVSLSGIVSSGPQIGQWTTLGSGTFFSDTALNTTYQFSVADTTAGFVDILLTSTYGCTDVHDTVRITITPGPQVEAGFGSTVCSNNADMNLSGAVFGGANDGRWSTSGGGVFVPNDSSLTATYSPDATEVSNGSVTFYLTSINNGGCNAEQDSVTVSISPAPTPNAGIDLEVCVDNGSQALNGIINNGPVSSVWTTLGSGTFSDSSSLSTVYTFSSADTAAGNVQLVLSTVAASGCLVETDTMLLTIITDSRAEAGDDFVTCESNDSISLNGVVHGANSGLWTSLSGGSFAPNDTTINATFIPDGGSGSSVTLVLTTTNTGACTPDSDTLVITREILQTANAGTGTIVCKGDLSTTLNGSIGGTATGGVWSSLTSGVFTPNDSTLNADYAFTTADTSAGEAVLVLTSNGAQDCPAVTDTVRITITDRPEVSAGGDRIVCANTPLNLAGSVTGPVGTHVWRSTGTGLFDDSTSLNTVYTISDADTTAGAIQVYLSYTVGCGEFIDTADVVITPAPFVDAGVNTSVCRSNPNISLNGIVTGGATTGLWSTAGTGTWNPDDSTLVTVYEPSVNDLLGSGLTIRLASTNNGDCIAESDSVVIVFTDGPVANAGNDFSVCVTSTSTILNGSISDSLTMGYWTSLGTGTFSPTDTNDTPLYNVTAADTTAGTVELVFTTIPPSGCLATSDTVLLTFVTNTMADAGTDITACANSDSLLLSGTVSGTTTGIWTSLGSGRFESDTSLNTSFIPASADADTVQLVLTTTNFASCPSDSDTLTVFLEAAPVVSAGSNVYLCGGSRDANLNAVIVQGATQIEWGTIGVGVISTSVNDLAINYALSDADTALGGVYLSVRTLDHDAGCSEGIDSVLVSFDQAVELDAGDPIIACANTIVDLSPSATDSALSTVWTTSGSGTFSSDTLFNPTYSFSTSDTAIGSVMLYLTSTFNCSSAQDSVEITITPAPYVNAGLDQTICRNNPSITLDGTVLYGATTGQWNTAATGLFTPNDSSLSTVFDPSVSDLLLDTIQFTLRSTDNEGCNVESDVLNAFFTNGPVADAGSNLSTCKTNASIEITGTISDGLLTGYWTTLGNGSFSPTDSALTTDYLISGADTTAGSVELVFTTIPPTGCLSTSDTMTLSFIDRPTANAGLDTAVCSDRDSVQLIGSVEGTTTGVWSILSGNGILTNDSTLTSSVLPGSLNADTTILILETTNTGSCPKGYDTVEVVFDDAPILDAGSNVFLCGGDRDAQLEVTIVNGASEVIWVNDGDGILSPSDSSLTIDYSLTDLDTAAGRVTFIVSSTDHNSDCQTAFDTVSVFFNDSPILDAGVDQVICANTELVLDATTNGTASRVLWTTNGTGDIHYDTSLSTTYRLSAADTASGSIMFYVTAEYVCDTLIDSVMIDITPAPSVDAGLSYTQCKNAGDLSLDGSVLYGATTGVWNSNTSGTFTPTDSTLNSAYTPSSADLDSGYVTLFLTSTNNGDCNSEMDSVTLLLIDGPIADAGGSRSVCITEPTITFSGLTGDSTTSGYWTSLGTGLFTPSDTGFTVDYGVTVMDTTAGMFDVVFTTIPDTGCIVTSDTVNITFVREIKVDLGEDFVTCEGIDSILLEAIIEGTDQGLWIHNGVGVLTPGDSVALVTYNIDSTDWGLDTLEFIFESNSGSTCPEDSDTLSVIIKDVPSIDAGINVSVCRDSLVVALDATVSIGTSVVWSTTGDGAFLTSDTLLQAIYGLGIQDSTDGVLNLILADTNSYCVGGNDTLILTLVNEEPVVTPSDQYVCESSSITVIGETNSNSNVLWQTLGDGSFSPDNADTTVYSYGTQDIDNAQVTLIQELITNCGSFYDTTTYRLNSRPVVDFGMEELCDDQSVAFSDSSSILSGSITSLTWDLGDSTSSDSSYVIHVYDSIQYYQVTLTAVSDSSCASSRTDSIQPFQILTLSYAPTDTSFSINEDITFEDSTLSTVSWFWDMGDGFTTYTDQSFIHNYTDTGVYEVLLAAVDSNGCNDTVYLPLIIDDGSIIGEDGIIAIPTGFTPNYDTYNDVLYVRGGPFLEFSFKVFNEWGNEVFSTSLPSEGWDGVFNGQEQPPGVYVYILRGVTEDGQMVEMSGEVTLMR